MSVITVAAARASQGTLTLFATTLKVKDLVRPGFYNVDTLDPEDGEKGYQRLLNQSRAKKLADYIVKGQETRDAFLPTSVFLATDKSIAFNEIKNEIEIDSALLGSFSVVDGQHRLEGLKMAAERDPRVLEFEVPVNIAINLSPLAQMCHFLIVNTTQKSVDRSVEQRIYARLTEAMDVEDLPSLPRWISNIVEKKEVDRAVKFVDYLNNTEGSPWLGKIAMANEVNNTRSINQKSFVKSIVKYVLTANNPLSIVAGDFDREKRIFLNYWKSITQILDEDGDSATLYKTIGVELFCRFSIPFFVRLQDKGSFTVETMNKTLRMCFEAIEGEYSGVGHPDWWKTGGKAGQLNAAALGGITQELSKALHKSSAMGTIEL
jgi:DGQHR domain-containing protein